MWFINTFPTGVTPKGSTKIFIVFQKDFYKPQSGDLKFCKTHARSLTSISFSSFIDPLGQGEQNQMALWGGRCAACLQCRDQFKSSANTQLLVLIVIRNDP